MSIRSKEELKNKLVSIDPAKSFKYKPLPPELRNWYYNDFNERIRSEVNVSKNLQPLVNKAKQLYKKGHSIAWMVKHGIDPFDNTTISTKNDLRRIIQYSIPAYPPQEQSESIMKRRLKKFHNNPRNLNNFMLTEAERLYPQFKQRIQETIANRKLTPQMREYLRRSLEDFYNADVRSAINLRDHDDTQEQLIARYKRIDNKTRGFRSSRPKDIESRLKKLKNDIDKHDKLLQAMNRGWTRRFFT